MFCAQCKAEYRDGITHCPECGVELVSLPLPQSQEGDACKDDPWQSAVVVWQGTDPLLADRILDILDEEGMEACSDRLLTPEMPIPSGRDSYGIWVHRKDEARARELIGDFLEAVEQEEKEESAPSRESEEGL